MNVVVKIYFLQIKNSVMTTQNTTDSDHHMLPLVNGCCPAMAAILNNQTDIQNVNIFLWWQQSWISKSHKTRGLHLWHVKKILLPILADTKSINFVQDHPMTIHIEIGLSFLKSYLYILLLLVLAWYIFVYIHENNNCKKNPLINNNQETSIINFYLNF